MFLILSFFFSPKTICGTAECGVDRFHPTHRNLKIHLQVIRFKAAVTAAAPMVIIGSIPKPLCTDRLLLLLLLLLLFRSDRPERESARPRAHRKIKN